jgi:1-acyl-sn-glycerol-3-phosphate acyltransferase
VVFQPIQWICFNLFGYDTHKKSVDILNWFLLSSYRVMGTRLNFENAYSLPSNQPIIFVSNHQSMFDIPGLIWYLHAYNPKFVSKKELSKGIPSISYNLKKSGAALIDRSKPDQALKEIERLGKFANIHNYSVAIFPEGTRSKTGILKPFAVKGFAKFIDCMPQALVVPVSIHNSWKFAQYGGFLISFGESLKWRVLQPLTLDGKKPSEILDLAEKAIREDLGQVLTP